MTSSSEKIIQFLEVNRDNFIKQWREKVIIDQSDIYKDRVEANGILMYELIKGTYRGTITDQDLRLLAHKVAKERVAANINIGDFVYNVNIGRSILVKFINRSGIPFDDLHPLIDILNSQFDLFCYYAVTKYTEIKNKELQEKIYFIDQTHKDRLSLLGQISSSFVHEFRNPLTSVIGFIKLLQAENPHLKYLDIIDHELDQLKFRITQFLHTSKMNVVEKENENISIEGLFDEIIKFLYPSLVDNDVNVLTEMDSLILINANRDELKQVLLNLLINSIDAVKQKEKPRKIMIKCFTKGKDVIMKVANNGPVIPPEIRKTIFEPFYTTKELGTGIGLYVCKKIIEKHQGYIICRSNEEQTSFTIRLPINQ